MYHNLCANQYIFLVHLFICLELFPIKHYFLCVQIHTYILFQIFLFQFPQDSPHKKSQEKLQPLYIKLIRIKILILIVLVIKTLEQCFYTFMKNIIIFQHCQENGLKNIMNIVNLGKNLQSPVDKKELIFLIYKEIQ